MDKKSLKSLIWSDFVEVYTDINYSSLYCEKLRSKQNEWYFWAIYTCFGLPPILSLIVKRYAIENDWLFFGMIALILLLPLAIRIKNKKLIYALFGIYEKEINGLLELNQDLENYKSSLLALYFQVSGMSEKSHKWGETELRYEKLKTDNARYKTEHDKLTGEIDPIIQKEAQDKTKLMIERASYYGRE